jgi:hypothetical protein
MRRVTQLHEPCFFDLVVLIGGVCPNLVSKLLVLDEIQRILDTAIMVNLNYPWEAQCEVARIGRPIKASRLQHAQISDRATRNNSSRDLDQVSLPGATSEGGRRAIRRHPSGRSSLPVGGVAELQTSRRDLVSKQEETRPRSQLLLGMFATQEGGEPWDGGFYTNFWAR